MVRYYDYEYSRIVDEQEVKRQYNYFSSQSWFNKTYEEFANDNFREIKELTETDREDEDFIYGQETASKDIEKYGLEYAMSIVKRSELFTIYGLGYEEYVLSQIKR
ncbi:hypothetical protein KQI61_07660 [Anaerocolumna aminovalerica]|uniref:hypothetical protein n=1 Tax=Anaerocolumna aminovalerica TaxID=1527 RepID=UPI001C0EA293|nr:hypothetical protein [Anaerocolumna aminovalerica]MBU5332072.1 hypothetical protein [Anaerocolumna aminovalerica]